MRAIFISYRRDDSEGQAGRLYDDLVRQFGDGSVFMDVAAIDPGLDFRRVIDNNVSSCGVLLALIGPAWLDAKDETGQRRLDNPLDFVRLETAAALKRDIPVVPVLVAKARMPRAEQLPDDLKELAYRNGVELTHARWDTDVQVLVKALQRHIDNRPLEGAGIRVKEDRVQDRAVETTTALAESKGAGTLPPDRPRPATKSWRTLIVAGVAAVAIAAGIGYALYEYRKASRDEEAKVRQAAADAAARQLAEDQKAAADREANRKAAGDEEAARKAALGANEPLVPRPSRQSQVSIPNFAGTWELIETTENGERKPIANAKRIHITQNGSLVKIGGQESSITADGKVMYKIFFTEDGQHGRKVETDAEATLVDAFTWRLEGSILTSETTFNYKKPYLNHPAGTVLRIMRYRRVDEEAAEKADKGADKRAAQRQSQSQVSIPNFAGTWEVIDATRNGEHFSVVGNAKRTTITQEGSLVKREGRELAITKDGKVTYKSFFAQDSQHPNGHPVENEAEAALVDTLTWRLEGSILVFETAFNYKARYGNHPICTDLVILRYRRVSP
jgi:hypothetical protein